MSMICCGHSAKDISIANDESCSLCLSKELAESKRTNERLVELLRLGMKTKTCGDEVDWRNEVRVEFRRLGLNV